MDNKKLKIGVFICRCGSNIADKLHFDSLKEKLKKLPDVLDVYEDNFFCAPAGKNKIIDIIKNNKLNRCCFAACSHRVHEKTFMNVAVEAGLNPYLIQLANIREHITWVINDKDKATEKAYHQIKAAIERLKYHKEIEKKYLEIKTDVAIIGGGIAGIKAAKLLAQDPDRTVYLIEKESSLGGWMPKWEKSFPTMDCNPCFLAPEISSLNEYKNIEVLTLSTVNDIKGFYGNFIINLTQQTRYISEACIGCMECYKVCPVTVKNEFNANMNERNGIYVPFPGCYPNRAVIDKINCLRFKGEECNKCQEACMFGAVDFSQQTEELTIEVGGIIIATGFDLLDIEDFNEYSYSGKNNIFSNYEFERMMSSSGPTEGHIKTREGNEPKSIAVIYCGGRKETGYCSAVCCGSSMKYAKFLLEHNPGIPIYQIYSELCLDGDGLQEMKESLEKAGVQFIKADDYKDIQCFEKDNNVTVKYKVSGTEKELFADMAVVSMGIKNTESTKNIADLIDISFNNEGWYDKSHNKMEPSTTVVEGVYLAGCSGGPADLQRSVISAKGAAGEAMSKLLAGKKIELEPAVSYTDEEKCGGCKMCISVCPYKAISFDEEKKVSIVNEVLCKGCGTCVSLCPAGALINRHFEDIQISHELEKLIL